MGPMRGLAFVFCLASFLFCGCDSLPDHSLSVRKAYLQQMIGPGAEVKTYTDLYTTHKIRCESGSRFFCTEAKVDLAHIERASQQLLAIAEEISHDENLSKADRQDAQQAIPKLQSVIERIRSAKPGTLPAL